jgi:hypothetical protein
MGCCHLPVPYEKYSRMPLPEQIDAWKQTRRELSGTCHLNSLQWLHRIADHGYAAANAMVPLIYQPQPDFPPKDTLYVLERAHRDGCDLKDQEKIVQALDWAKNNAADSSLRAGAAELLKVIETERPSPQLRCPDVPEGAVPLGVQLSNSLAKN